MVIVSSDNEYFHIDFRMKILAKQSESKLIFKSLLTLTISEFILNVVIL